MSALYFGGWRHDHHLIIGIMAHIFRQSLLEDIHIVGGGGGQKNI